MKNWRTSGNAWRLNWKYAYWTIDGTQTDCTVCSNACFSNLLQAPFICFLSFLPGILLSFPAMIRPGWTMLSRYNARSMGVESKQYWYASWLGMLLVKPCEYSHSRNMILAWRETLVMSAVVRVEKAYRNQSQSRIQSVQQNPCLLINSSALSRLGKECPVESDSKKPEKQDETLLNTNSHHVDMKT